MKYIITRKWGDKPSYYVGFLFDQWSEDKDCAMKFANREYAERELSRLRKEFKFDLQFEEYTDD